MQQTKVKITNISTIKKKNSIVKKNGSLVVYYQIIIWNISRNTIQLKPEAKRNITVRLLIGFCLLETRGFGDSFRELIRLEKTRTDMAKQTRTYRLLFVVNEVLELWWRQREILRHDESSIIQGMNNVVPWSGKAHQERLCFFKGFKPNIPPIMTDFIAVKCCVQLFPLTLCLFLITVSTSL